MGPPTGRRNRGATPAWPSVALRPRIITEPVADPLGDLLARYARGRTPQLTGADLGRALRGLDVSMVCVKQGRADAELPRLAEAGYAAPQRLADMTCVTPAG